MKNLFFYLSVVLFLLSNYFYAQSDKNITDTEGFVYQVKDLQNGQFLNEFMLIDPFPSKLSVAIRTQNQIEYS